MSTARRPSPDKQVMLKSSHLHGMERPVRSFRSFIRAIPPRASPEKPLPPIPSESPSRKRSSSSSLSPVRTRSTKLSLWEPPLNWDNNEESHQDQSTLPLPPRQYSPLIPEPPEDIAAMQADPVLWQQGHGPFQQTPLDPIHERNVVTPELPPRNPSRLSTSLSSPATTRKNSGSILPSVSSRYSTGTFDDGPSTKSTPGAPHTEDAPSPLDLVSALSDMAMNQTAFTTVGPETSRDRGILWNRQHQRADSAQHETNTNLDAQDDELKMFRKGNVQPDDGPGIPEESGISEKMQALIFAQDYHKTLSQRSPKEHNILPDVPLRDQELTPQPLAWRKESSCTPQSVAPQRPQLPPASSSGRPRNFKMMSSWVNQRLNRFNQRSVSDPGSSPQLTIPESEVDRHLKHEARLVNMIHHSREFVHRKILRRETEPARRLVISHPIPQPSAQPPIDSTSPFELARPVLRLPGGLTLVRQTPSSIDLRPQTASANTTESPSSPFSDLSWPDFPVSSPFRRNFSRRGSLQSTHSQPAASPSRPFHRSTSSPLASPTTFHSFSPSFSRSTPSLPALTPQDTHSPSSPYSPPPPRRRSHNIGSPLSAPPASIPQGAFDALEGVGHKLNLFEKARYAHDSWKKHQREVRAERLKQSIRLVGPADATDVAGYIKCAIDGRVSGDSGVDDGGLTRKDMA